MILEQDKNHAKHTIYNKNWSGEVTHDHGYNSGMYIMEVTNYFLIGFKSLSTR